MIVYVALNPMMKSNLAGMLTWMTRAGHFRYVRASISPDLTPHQMIATIAHELQHAVEVMSGDASPSRWVTTAAQQAGFQVRKEVAEARSTTLARVGEVGRW